MNSFEALMFLCLCTVFGFYLWQSVSTVFRFHLLFIIHEMFNDCVLSLVSSRFLVVQPCSGRYWSCVTRSSVPKLHDFSQLKLMVHFCVQSAACQEHLVLICHTFQSWPLIACTPVSAAYKGHISTVNPRVKWFVTYFTSSMWNIQPVYLQALAIPLLTSRQVTYVTLWSSGN